MQYIFSTLRVGELRNAPTVLVIAAVLSLGFLFSALYMRAEGIANILTGRTSAAIAVRPEPIIPNTGTPGAGAVAEGPMISFNFDNGFESAYRKALPIFEKADLRTTHYIITDRIGYSGYVNAAQIAAMSKRGHEIGAESQEFGRLIHASSEAAREEIEGSRKDLQALGLPANTFAYPHGETNASLQEFAREAGFIGARAVGGDSNAVGDDPYALSAFQVVSGTSFDEVKAAIDQAVADREWIILVFYRVDEPGAQDGRNVSSSFIQRIVNYVKALNIPVVTTEEGLSQ